MQDGTSYLRGRGSQSKYLPSIVVCGDDLKFDFLLYYKNIMKKPKSITDLIKCLKEHSEKLCSCYIAEVNNASEICFRYKYKRGIHRDKYLHININSGKLNAHIQEYTSNSTCINSNVIKIKLCAFDYIHLVYNQLKLYSKVRHLLDYSYIKRLMPNFIFTFIKVINNTNNLLSEHNKRCDKFTLSVPVYIMLLAMMT